MSVAVNEDVRRERTVVAVRNGAAHASRVSEIETVIAVLERQPRTDEVTEMLMAAHDELRAAEQDLVQVMREMLRDVDAARRPRPTA